MSGRAARSPQLAAVTAAKHSAAQHTRHTSACKQARESGCRKGRLCSQPQAFHQYLHLCVAGSRQPVAGNRRQPGSQEPGSKVAQAGGRQRTRAPVDDARGGGGLGAHRLGHPLAQVGVHLLGLQSGAEWWWWCVVGGGQRALVKGHGRRNRQGPVACILRHHRHTTHKPRSAPRPSTHTHPNLVSTHLPHPPARARRPCRCQWPKRARRRPPPATSPRSWPPAPAAGAGAEMQWQQQQERVLNIILHHSTASIRRRHHPPSSTLQRCCTPPPPPHTHTTHTRTLQTHTQPTHAHTHLHLPRVDRHGVAGLALLQLLADAVDHAQALAERVGHLVGNELAAAAGGWGWGRRRCREGGSR